MLDNIWLLLEREIMRKTRGILFIIGAAFCFAVMGAFIRLSGDLPTVQKAFFRNLISALITLAVVLKSREHISLDIHKVPLLIARSTAGTLGLLCNFYAVDHLQLADASMFNKLSPFFTIIASIVILREKAKPYQIWAIAIAFAGAIVVLKPSASIISNPASLIAISGAAFAGMAYTLVRKLGNEGVPGPVIILFFSTFSCLVTIPFMIYSFTPMTGAQLGLLILTGVAGAGGQFCVTGAYTNAPAKEISVFDYTQIVFSALLGFFIFGQTESVTSYIGYTIIIGAAIYMFIRNRNQEDVV